MADQHPDYWELRQVLDDAFADATSGKGQDRHSDGGKPFQHQTIMQELRALGTNAGHIFQTRKKVLEAHQKWQSKGAEWAYQEVLGAIVYLAVAASWWRRKFKTEEQSAVGKGKPPHKTKPTIEPPMWWCSHCCNYHKWGYLCPYTVKYP